MLHSLIRLLAALLAASGLAATGDASAQAQFPTKPQRFIAMSSGFPENTARVLGAEIAEISKQPVIVEAKPGANGILAAEYVAKSAPNGYTLLIGTNSTHAANQSLYKSLPYDYINDFIPVSGISKGVLLALVNAQVPAKNIAELTALARKNPGKLTYGAGSTSGRAAAELYKLISGVDITHVPYKSAAQASMDLLAGRVDFMMVNPGGMMPYVQAGKLRALAVSTKQRWSGAPDTPTMQEAGVPDYELTFWLGAWLPAKTPMEIVTRVNELIVAALNRPKYKEYMNSVGSVAFPSTSDELMKFQIAEQAKWKKIIVAGGIQVE